MKKSALTVILIVTMIKAMAQQQPVLSQQAFNNYYFNPAYTGTGELYNFSFLYRSQWSGYEDYTGASGAPRTELFTTYINLDSTGHSMGLLFSRDRAGLLTTFHWELSYTYRVFLTEKSTLALGLRGGMVSRSLDPAKYIILHADDPNLPQGRVTETRPDLTLGMWLNHEKYFAGFAVNGLIADTDAEPLAIRSEKNFVITAGYHFYVPVNLKFTPSVQVVTNTNQTLLQGSFVCMYNDALWAGLSYRHEESATLLAGFSFLDRKFRLGYAFDYVTQNPDAKTGTSHEVMLTCRL